MRHFDFVLMGAVCTFLVGRNRFLDLRISVFLKLFGLLVLASMDDWVIWKAVLASTRFVQAGENIGHRGCATSPLRSVSQWWVRVNAQNMNGHTIMRDEHLFKERLWKPCIASSQPQYYGCN